MKRILILMVALFAVQSALAGGPLDKKRVKTVSKSKAEQSAFDKAVELYAADQVDEAYALFLKEMKNADHKGYAATYIGSMMADADEMDAALNYLQQAEGNIPAKDSAFLAFFHGLYRCLQSWGARQSSQPRCLSRGASAFAESD